MSEQLSESNASKNPDFIEKVGLSPEEKTISVAANGVITIPAVAFTTSTEKPSSYFVMAAPGGACTAAAT